MNKKRCQWTKNNPWNNEYHDKEWGLPIHNDQKLFEFLILDTFQAGLSWLSILKKRENFHRAFDAFDAQKMALYNEAKIEVLMQDKGIIRNRLKIKSAVSNAQNFLRLQQENGSFDHYIWQFTGGKTIDHARKSNSEIPVRSKESDAMSKSLKKEGFKFVGTIICYAFMQAAGMINDHSIDCFRYEEVKQ